MRRNIYDILHTAEIDLLREYHRLYEQFYLIPLYGRTTIAKEINYNFSALDKTLIGRCISILDFNETYGYTFQESPEGFDIDYLVTFAEYIINFLKYSYGFLQHFKEPAELKKNVYSCMEDIGYKDIDKEGYIIFIENNASATAVAEIVEPTLSYQVLEYNHHRLKGDVVSKQSILKRMADDIEPQRKQLNIINNSLSNTLFQLLNKFVRHSHEGTDYIGTLNSVQLENIYDDIYQLWLLAKLELDNVDRKQHMKDLLAKIND